MFSSKRLAMVSIALVVVALTILTPAAAIKESTHTLDDIATMSPRLHISQEVATMEAFRAEGVTPQIAERAMAWDRFLSTHGTQWTLMMDRVTGMPALVEGSGIPWLPGRGNSLTAEDIRPFLGTSLRVNNAVVDRIARAFILENQDLLPVASEDLQLVPGATGEFGGYLHYVQYQQFFAGIPVEGSVVVFRVNNGNLVQFGAEKVAPVNLSPVPSFDSETARAILAGYLGGLDEADEWIESGRLSILPVATQDGRGMEHALVYNFAFRRPGVMGTWVAKVDAHTGEVLSFADDNKYGSVTGGILPSKPTDAEVIRPLPQITVTNGTTKYTDRGGNYTFATGTASAALTGKYVKVTDSCGTSSLSTSTSPGDLAFNKGTGTDCTTPGVGGSGNTRPARSTYYHITNWKLKAMAWLPSNTWLQGQLTDKVNLNQTCNAYWDGSSVNFFKSGGGCANTGELPTVFLHEAAHGLDSNDGNGFSPDKGTGESYADTAAFLSTHDSCVGTGFFTDGSKCSGYGDACTTCTGIRDVDYAKHTSGVAHTPLNFTKVKCPTSSTYKGPCGKEGHCEGYIAAEAMWDLAARDLPNPGTPTAWFIAERLFYLTRPTAGAAFTCNTSTFASDGCGTSHYFTIFRVADDDDGNLSNGTPHAAAIYAAFNRHAIACSSVVNTNSTTCAAVGQPTLTATAGSGQVALSWTAASGATKYWVLRNEMSATAGMDRMAEVTGTTYTDTVVAPGITYYYSVLGLSSNNACFGTLAAVKSATPTGGTTTTYSISGTVSGATASGVTVSLTGSATGTTTTATDGTYTFSGLANGSYTVTPSKSGYTFSPSSTAVTISGANQTGKNFTATAATTYSISGTVSGATASGVTMSLTGASTASTTTATDGTYTFSGLANGSYTVTPSKTGYTFSPTSTAVTVSGANQTGKNFTATAVTTGDTPLTSGVGQSSSVAQGAYKYYTIVVPSGATALSITLTGLSADVDLYCNNSTTHPTTSAYYGRSWNSGTTSETLSYTNPTVATWCIGVYGYAAGNFTVTATVTAGATTYSISGTVSGATASGVTMTLTGAASKTATTDTSGNYTFTGLANGSYTVTPSKTGFTFAPTSTAVTISGANQTGKNFTATATTTTYSISGTVSGATASGVTMTLTGAASKTATTDTSGNYTFTGLANGSYTVTPSKTGFTFAPTSTAVTISGANQTGKNFTATAASGDTQLTSGVAVNGSVALQAYMYYYITVPTGTASLVVDLYNLTADVDLYAKVGVKPTTTSYDYKSENGSTTAEKITYTSPAAGTYYIAAYGYAAGSYTVKATVTAGGGATTLFTNGLESTTGWTQVDTSGTAGTWSIVASGTNPTCSKHGGSYMGMFNSYNAANGSATRYYNSTTFNDSAYATVTLSFWMYHDTGYSSNADKVQPQISLDGTNWINVGSAINRYDGSTGWKQHSVSIAGNKGSAVRVGFLATSAYGNNMFLDDVTVVAQ